MALQNTFYFDVDFKYETHAKEPRVTQNDEVTFVLRLYDDGVPFSLTNISTYTLVSQRKDKQSILTNGTKTDDNEITFTLGTTELNVPGKVKAAIQLYDVSGRISSIPFTYTVLDDLAEGYIPSTDEQTLIELVLGEGPAILQAAEDVTAEANEFLANNVRFGDYDNTVVYAKGNEVGFDGSSYVALQNTQGNLPTDTTYWALRARKGLGDVNSVNGELPDGNGNVTITIPDPDLSGLATKVDVTTQLSEKADKTSLEEVFDRSLKSIEVLETDPTTLWNGRIWLLNIPMTYFQETFTQANGTLWDSTKWRTTEKINPTYLSTSSTIDATDNKGSIKIASNNLTQTVGMQKTTLNQVVKLNEYREVEFEINDYFEEDNTFGGFTFAISPTPPVAQYLFAVNNWIRFFVGYETTGRYIRLQHKVNGTLMPELFKKIIPSDTGLKRYRFVFFNQDHYKLERFNGTDWTTLYENFNSGLSFTDGYIVIERVSYGTTTIKTSYIDNILIKG